MTTETSQPGSPAEVAGDAVDEQLAARLVEQAKTQGTNLVGPDGLLPPGHPAGAGARFGGELTGRLGYEHGDPAGRDSGNSAQRQPRQDRHRARSARWRSACPATVRAPSSR